jgi:hypothetical protein
MRGHELIWLPRGEKVPELKCQVIQSKKSMMVIIWNPHDFHSVTVLDKGCKFPAMHHSPEIFWPLSKHHAFDISETDRKLIVHAPNARPHIARLSVELIEDGQMQTAPKSRFPHALGA